MEDASRISGIKDNVLIGSVARPLRYMSPAERMTNIMFS